MNQKRVIILVSFMVFSFAGCGMKEASDTTSLTETVIQSETGQYVVLQPVTEESASMKKDSYLDTVPAEYEISADLTHDGKDEMIKVSVKSETDDTRILVYDDGQKIFEQENPIHDVLGNWYGIVRQEDGAYLMRYAPLIDHDMITCRYEVFSLDDTGEKIGLDSGEIEEELWHLDTFNTDKWYAFAEEENRYFKNATLLVSTLNGQLEIRNKEIPQTYEENFVWTVSNNPNEWKSNKNSMKDNLSNFLIKYKDEYSGE